MLKLPGVFNSSISLVLSLLIFLCLPILTINAYFWTLVLQELFIATFSALLAKLF